MVVDMIDKAHIMGFGSIKDVVMTDKKQCVRFNVKYLYGILKAFDNMKAEEIYITVENGKPMLLGGKEKGIVLAPIIESETQSKR